MYTGYTLYQHPSGLIWIGSLHQKQQPSQADTEQSIKLRTGAFFIR